MLNKIVTDCTINYNILNMRTNFMSALGRTNYTVHYMFYPTFMGLVYFVGLPWKAERDAAAKAAEWEGMVKRKAVDPDLFNPFSPIPFHNSIQVHYGTAHIKMQNFVKESSHINEDTYVWKNYHHSFDHGNKKSYTYNWTSV